MEPIVREKLVVFVLGRDIAGNGGGVEEVEREVQGAKEGAQLLAAPLSWTAARRAHLRCGPEKLLRARPALHHCTLGCLPPRVKGNGEM